MSYSAIVARIKVRPHPNADRLKLGSVCGEQVIVGLDTQDNELGVYFSCDGQLSPIFCEANDLIARTDPETGGRAGGFFDLNRRVRTQRFRGERSYGYWCSLESLYNVISKIEKSSDKTAFNIAVARLEEGDEFTELAGIPICNKYITSATRASGQHNKPKLRKKNIRFPEHFDTQQFNKNWGKIPVGSLIYISEKMHGTSGRYAYIQEEVIEPLPWYKKVCNKLGFKFEPKSHLEWARVVGSRRVQLNGPEHSTSWYATHGGSEQFRFDVCKDWLHLLRKGEIVYGEIVGWMNIDTPIMQSVSTKVLQDKEFTKKYGEKMTFTYGCPKGTCKFYVYRITQINEDGYQVDLPWSMVQKRATELGIQCVPSMWQHPYYVMRNTTDEGCIVNTPNTPDTARLQDVVTFLNSGPDLLDPSHIREGVCIRIENQYGVEILKSKNWEFLTLEDGAKAGENYVDTEEAASADES